MYWIQDGKRSKFISRHSSDALDKAAHVHPVGSGNPASSSNGGIASVRSVHPTANMTAAIMLRASSSVSDDQYKSLDRFGSLDSSDTFLSCATHPFPSQGSLAGLEELAAVGSMAANGSMPAVNIPSFNSTMHNANNYGYIVNPFDPTRRRIRGECVTPKGTLTPSPQGSPQSQHRTTAKMVRIHGRSASSDVELANSAADFESDFSASNRDAYHEEIAPKHRKFKVL